MGEIEVGGKEGVGKGGLEPVEGEKLDPRKVAVLQKVTDLRSTQEDNLTKLDVFVDKFEEYPEIIDTVVRTVEAASQGFRRVPRWIIKRLETGAVFPLGDNYEDLESIYLALVKGRTLGDLEIYDVQEQEKHTVNLTINADLISTESF